MDQDKYDEMKGGASIKDVFNSPGDVDLFIRKLIDKLEETESADKQRHLSFSKRVDKFKHEMEAAIYDAQKRNRFDI